MSEEERSLSYCEDAQRPLGTAAASEPVAHVREGEEGPGGGQRLAVASGAVGLLLCRAKAGDIEALEGQEAG